MTWIVSLRRWRRQSIGDRYPRHYFLYDRGLLGNLLLILLGLQGPWTPAFSSSVSKQHAPEDLLAICLPNVCHVFGVQPQLVFHMLVLLCRTFVAWSGFCICQAIPAFAGLIFRAQKIKLRLTAVFVCLPRICISFFSPPCLSLKVRQGHEGAHLVTPLYHT